MGKGKKKRKRLYSLTYPATGRPAYVEDAGHLLKMSGVLLQGMFANFLLLSPTAVPVTPDQIHVIIPTLEEWCEVLRRSDDPLFFEQDESGQIKACHRKQQRAISGAIQQKVFQRDGYKCMFCGKAMGDVQLTVDHFVPLELGGANEMGNYISACRQCNKAKGSVHPKEYCESRGLCYEALCMYLVR